MRVGADSRERKPSFTDVKYMARPGSDGEDEAGEAHSSGKNSSVRLEVEI